MKNSSHKNFLRRIVNTKKIATFLTLSTLFMIFATAIFFFISPVQAKTTNNQFLNNYEHVTSFQSNITLNKDATLDVKEIITVNHTTPRHGIYRYIPTKLPNKQWWQLQPNLKIISVKYYPTNKPNQVKSFYEISSDSNNKIIKIGEADVTFIGSYAYEITYQYKYTIIYNDNSDELYFNITGNGWTYPVDHAKAIINLPNASQKTICYTGLSGSTTQACTISSQGQIIKVASNILLLKNEGLTMALTLPKNSVTNTKSQQMLTTIIAFSGLLLFFPIALIGFILWWLWGKDPTPETIVPTYHAPQNIPPAYGGFIYSQSLQNKYLSAELIFLAINGYLKIKQLSGRKYEFIKLSKDYQGLHKYQTILLKGLFAKKNVVTMSSLKNTFHATVIILKSTLHSFAKTKGVLLVHSEYLKTLMFIITGVLVFLGILLAIITLSINPLWIFWPTGILLGTAVFFFFTLFMTKRSLAGNKTYTKLMGVRMYIKTAEQHRIEFHNNPRKAIKKFEELLPYAMIFNLEKMWGKEFKDLYTKPPDWYQGNFRTFNAYYLASSLGSMASSFSAVTAPPSTSGSSSFGGGGGFSGGGFGGGGGGSW